MVRALASRNGAYNISGHKGLHLDICWLKISGPPIEPK